LRNRESPKISRISDFHEKGGKMWTISQIRRLANKLPKGELFTTRDCLLFGSRAAVDKAISRLVDFGELRRITRGVFCKSSDNNRRYSVLEVAAVKARAFGKEIYTHGIDAAHKLKLLAEGNKTPTFATNGCTSMFRYRGVAICLKGVSRRKTHFQDTATGLLIRAVWQLGKRNSSREIVWAAPFSRLRTDRQQLLCAVRLMPSWMREILVHIKATVYGKK
jgi:hypothetical protein